MDSFLFQILVALAAIFIGALLGGRLASLCRIPRVTGYLVVGLLIGPSLAGLANLPTFLPVEVLGELRLISDLALALILMHIGGLFEIQSAPGKGTRIKFTVPLSESVQH